MDGREIPGYYYDREKKKYFKIMANHVAVPGSRYSKDSVVRVRKEEEKRDSEATRSTAVKTQLLHRSRVLRSAVVAGICVEREIACRITYASIGLSRERAYAAGFREAWKATADVPFSTFAVDPLTKNFITGLPGRDDSLLQGAFKIPFSSQLDPEAYSSRATNELSQMSPTISLGYNNWSSFGRSISNEISSVKISPSRVVLMTTMGGKYPASISIMPLMDEALQEPDAQLQCDVMITFQRQDKTDIWACTTNPFVTAPDTTFATALTDKVILYTENQGAWSEDVTLPTHTDSLAVEWLTPTVLSIGHRDGLVKLWDIRSSGSALRLQHSGLVTDLRRIDSERLVVCGTQNALAMYDLRMPAPDQLGRKPAKRRKRVPLFAGASQPVVQYAFESGDRRLGFDVSPGSGTVAAVDREGLVQLFALHSGERVKTLWPPTRGGESSSRALTTHLEFTSCLDNDGREELLASCGGDLLSWCW